MKRSLWICSLWLGLLITYFLIVGGAVTIALLVLSILLMAYCISSVSRAAKTLTSKVENANAVVKSEPTTYEIRLEVAQKIPALKAKVHICVTHTALNVKQYYSIETAIYRSKMIIPFETQHNYCGQYEIAITQIEISDILQLFTKNVVIESDSCCKVVKPISVQKAQFTKLQMSWQQGQAAMSNSLHQDGEERAQLKVYTPGDQVKKIHWKLSSKLDEVYVQQFSIPQKQEVIFAIDCSNVDGKVDVYDTMIEKLAALLMLALQGENVKFAYVQQGWQVQMIRTETEIVHTLHMVLTKSAEQLALSAGQHEQLIEQYSNVYIVTPENCGAAKFDEQMRSD